MKKNNKRFTLEAFNNVLLVLIDNYPINENIFNDILVDNPHNIEKDNIEKDLKNLQTIFNFLSISNPQLASKLDNRYGIINKSLTEDVSEVILLASGSQSSWGILRKNGTLEINGCFGGELKDFEIKRDYYSKNPILFNLENFNPKLLDSFFENENNINPGLIRNALVRNVYLNNNEAITYLFSNEKCIDIIRSSNDIKLFINSDENFSKNKKLARISLTTIELEKRLPINLATKNRKKIKS